MILTSNTKTLAPLSEMETQTRNNIDASIKEAIDALPEEIDAFNVRSLLRKGFKITRYVDAIDGQPSKTLLLRQTRSTSVIACVENGLVNGVDLTFFLSEI